MGLHPLHASHCRSACSAAAPSLQKGSRCSLGMAAASHLRGLLTLVPLVGPDSPLLPPHVKRVTELILGSAGLGSLEKEDLQKRVSESFLQDKHKEPLLAALQNGFVGKAARTQQQNWVHLFHYLPTALLKWLQQEECVQYKTEKVVAWLSERGLHSPSEPTLAAVTVLVNYQNQTQLLQPCSSLEVQDQGSCLPGEEWEEPEGWRRLAGAAQRPLLPRPSVFPAGWRNFKALVACVPLRSNHGDLVTAKRHKRLHVLHTHLRRRPPCSWSLCRLRRPCGLPRSPCRHRFRRSLCCRRPSSFRKSPCSRSPSSSRKSPCSRSPSSSRKSQCSHNSLHLPQEFAVQETLQLPEPPVAAAPKLVKKRSLLESVADLAELRKNKAAKKARDPEELKEKEAEAPAAKRRG